VWFLFPSLFVWARSNRKKSVTGWLIKDFRVTPIKLDDKAGPLLVGEEYGMELRGMKGFTIHSLSKQRRN
jgi:hypothetical protein